MISSGRLHSIVVSLILSALISSCGREQAPPLSLAPGAQPEIVASLRQDLETERHPADGGGQARLELDDSVRVDAGDFGTWSFVYETGPLGIAAGGMLYFQVSPFWGWSTPQVVAPESPGFTLVETRAEGVELEATTLDQQLLGIGIGGRALAPGETIHIVYGAGPKGARADRFAESRSPFYFAVDGNGDGIRGLVENPPTVAVAAGPPAILQLTLPSTARPGERVDLSLAVLDRRGNAVDDCDLVVQLEGPPEIEIEDKVLHLDSGNEGHLSIPVTLSASGVFRLRGRAEDSLAGVSNPILVEEDSQTLLWGDLHGHSSLSDGTGTVDDYFRYAREIAALDVVALTDHDHWGMQPLATHAGIWAEIEEATRRYHDPGTFVTLLGYEWTNWLHGHRHVLYFQDHGEVLSAIDPRYETPPQLWAALQGQEVLTFAHHSAGGPIATNWDYPPDAEIEPMTEIASVHGSSESEDGPGLIYSPQRGNFVRDVLDRGYRLGFVGSGDSHDGHPGLSHIASPVGGLTAIFSDDRTREGILEALRSRRAYATNGPRILLQTSLDGHRMGAIIDSAGIEERQHLVVRVSATEALETVDIIRSGEIVESISGDGSATLAFARQIEPLRPGEYLYLRVIQDGGGAAWSSPFFAD